MSIQHKSSLVSSEILKENYYEASYDVNFPAIDSLSSQGMFQFTVSQSHPIRGVDLLKKICKLYGEQPKLYFVVPGEGRGKCMNFENFKKQNFMKGNVEVAPIPKLKQYVLKLPLSNLSFLK